MLNVIRLSALIAALGLAFPAMAAKAPKAAAKSEPALAGKVEIELSHQFGRVGEERLQQLVERFNSEQKGVAIKVIRQAVGGKPATLNLVQRQDVLAYIADKDNFKPLYQMMADAKEPFKGAEISADLKAGVVDEKGRFYALPVAYSTPVLFYNKNAFRKAGLDPENPPKSWLAMQEVAGKLLDAGVRCPYTTSWPAWVHVDNVSALSGVPVATAKGELAFNGLPQVKHVAMMATWQKAGYFRSFGRANEADKHFLNGECAMITTNSWTHTEFREAQGVELGIAPMPFHDDVYGGRQHTLADGASLWIGGGYKPQEYKAAAKFVTFLLAKDNQIEMARTYGQLPLSQAARIGLKGKDLRDRDQTMDVAYASLRGEGATHPLRISGIEPVRIILDEELEAVWSDQKPAKAALDTAVQRGNVVLSAKPALKKALPF